MADPVYSDCGATVLANYQQTKISAPPNLNEPIGFDVLPDGRVLQTARGGQLRLHDPDNGSTKVIAELPVYTNSEDGLYGPAIDNDFATNQWVYLYYAPPTVRIKQVRRHARRRHDARRLGARHRRRPVRRGRTRGVGYFQLSRFKFVDGANPRLDLASEQKILQVPNNRGACCHVAGDIDFDTHNNLWLVTGDDTPVRRRQLRRLLAAQRHETDETQTVARPHATNAAASCDARASAALGLNTQRPARAKSACAITTSQEALDGVRTTRSRPARQSASSPTATRADRRHRRRPPRSTRWASATRSGSRSTTTTSPTSPTTRPTPPTPENFRGPAGTGRVEIVRKPSNYGWPLCVSPQLPYYRWNFNTSKPLDATPTPARVRQPDARAAERVALEHGRSTVPRRPITPHQPDLWYSFRDNANPPLGTPCLASYDGSDGTCPQLFPELYTGGVAPHGAAKYRYDADNPSHDEVPAVLRRRDLPRRVRPGHAARGPRSTPDNAILKINRLLDCGDFVAPTAARCRSSATRRWTCSSGPTARSTC